MGYKRVTVLIILSLLVYLSLYTWNLKSGVLDRLAAHTGLEVASLVLKPGKWVSTQVSDFWGRYISLVGVHQENDDLRAQLNALKMENMQLQEASRKAGRLEGLMGFKPDPGWSVTGARVIAQRLGPMGVLNTIVVDKGVTSDVEMDDPAIRPEGVVGRVLRSSAHSAKILLLTDPNSRIAVISRNSRTVGILTGQGPGEPLAVRYIPLNAPLEKDEIFVTSGLAGIYPKGIPVGRVSSVRRSDISLFQSVEAVPLVDLKRIEEVLMVHPGARGAGILHGAGGGNATANANSTNGSAGVAGVLNATGASAANSTAG